MARKPLLRLVQTSSRWGNLYRFRYYVNGRRVSYADWKRRKDETSLTLIKSAEATSYGWRDTWEGYSLAY